MYLFILLLLIIDYLSLWIESLYSRRWYEMFAQASVWNSFSETTCRVVFFFLAIRNQDLELDSNLFSQKQDALVMASFFPFLT